MSTAMQANPSSARILIVDDEEGVRLTLAANLELAGFEVMEAASAEQALELIQRERVDLVLSDVRMPGVGGIALLTALRSVQPGLPVVLMTAFTSEESVNTAYASGVFTVLRKPFDPDRQAATLRRAMRRPLVLVMDEHPQSATEIALALSRRGVRAEAAFESEHAIAAVRSGAIDVCVTGLATAGVDALETSRRLRALDPDVSLIVCATARVGDNVMREVAALGSTRCLRKPLDVLELIRSIALARSDVR